LLQITALITISNTFAMDNNLYIHVLDVGQGDAMLVHQPGTCAVLIDAGPPINGHLVTGKIRELGIEALDMVIVTHPHLDHFAGLFDLMPRIPVKHFYDNGLANAKWEYFDDYVTLRNRQPYTTLSRGMNLTCGGVKLDALYPQANPDPEAGLNDTSLALLVSFGDFTLLHMGDLAGAGEKQFLELGPAPEADVIKVGHHGAIDSTSEELLQDVSPKQAMISTATQNRIGSPAEAVLERLLRHGIVIYRTDAAGDITIEVNPDGYVINTEKRSGNE